MKKSEMINKVAEHFQTNGYPKNTLKLTKLYLNAFEEAGMLPPDTPVKNKMDSSGIVNYTVNEWESE